MKTLITYSFSLVTWLTFLGVEDQYFYSGSLWLSGNPDDDNEKIILPDKGYGSMPPQVLMTVVNAVVMITGVGTGFIGRVKLSARDCIVLVTNNHVFKDESAALKSKIKFEGKDDDVALNNLMIKGSYSTNPEVSD